MSLRKRAWAFAAVVLTAGAGVLVACSSSNGDGGGDDDAVGDSSVDVIAPASDGGDDDAGDPAELSACQNYLDAYCKKLLACQPYASFVACEAAKSSCPDSLFGSGSTLTPSDVSQCTVALAGATCVDFFNNPPASCAKPGTRAVGAACAYDSQCQSSKCVDASGHCGHCARVAGDGERCGSGEIVCPAGKYCDQTATCTPLPPIGSPCSVADPPYVYCPQGLVCARKPDQTSDETTCQAPAKAGQPCNVDPYGPTGRCDSATASCDYVDASTGAGNCVALGNPGDPCGFQSVGTFVKCNGRTSYCAFDNPFKGMCSALAKVGDACGTQGSTNITCDPTTSYCKQDRVDQPGTCTPLLVYGQECGAMPTALPDGGPSSSQYSPSCTAGMTCSNYFGYYSPLQDGGPDNPQCVTGMQAGLEGQPCGHGTYDSCIPSFACIDHVCARPDLSTCN